MRIGYVFGERLEKLGSGNTHMRAIASGLRCRGHSVWIYGPSYGLKAPRRLAGMSVLGLPLPPRSLASALLYWLLSPLAILILLLVRRVDVLYIRGAGGTNGPLVCRIARMLGIATVTEINGIAEEERRVNGYPELLCRAVARMTRSLYRNADRIVAVTEGIAEEIVRQQPAAEGRAVVIHNGANAEQFRPMDRNACRRTFGLPADRFIVGYLGSFARWYGIMEVARAAHILRDRGRQDLLVVLVGGGARWREVRTFIRAHGLGGIVRLLPEISNDQAPQMMNAFDVGVLNVLDPRKARYGLSCLKFWEMLACGLPVLIQQGSNLADMVSERGCGLVADLSDPAELADAVERLAGDRASLARMSRAAGRVFEDGHSWLDVAAAVERVLLAAARPQWARAN